MTTTDTTTIAPAHDGAWHHGKVQANGEDLEEFERERIVLSICDESGIACAPWREDPRYEVIQIDPLLDGSDVILDTIEDVLGDHSLADVSVVLAQPPCTHFASSGARWWADKGEAAIREGLSVVDACLRWVAITQPDTWVLENPVGRLRRWIGAPRWYVHPWECAHYAADPEGDAYTKKTCLFGDFVVPELKPWEGEIDTKRIHWISPSEDRKRLRSLAPEGIWRAIYEANRTRVPEFVDTLTRM